MARSRDLTDHILSRPAGTVVLGRSSTFAGSVWVVIDGDRLGPDGADGAGRLVCLHASHPAMAGQVRTEAQIRLLRMHSDDWRVAPATEAVRGTPARLA